MWESEAMKSDEKKFESEKNLLIHNHEILVNTILDEKKRLEQALVEATTIIKSLVYEIRNNGYFDEWPPDFVFDVVVDGEINKHVWAKAKSFLENVNFNKGESHE